MTIAHWWRYIHKHPRTGTVLVALGAFVASGPASRLDPPQGTHTNTWWPAVLLAAVACTSLLWHERHPRITAGVAVACTVVLTGLGYLLTVLLLAPAMAALYWLAAHTDRRTALAFVIPACALVVGTALIADPAGYPWVLKTIGPAAWLLGSASLGGARRFKDAYLDAVRARAEYAERTRDAEASRQVADERTRIARELHDVVAHHITLAHAQAGTARHLARTHPDQTEQILTALTATTTSALRDLKVTVGLLRASDDTDAPLEPTPSLAELPELARTFATAGLAVTVTTRGDRPPLTPSVDLTAYRIAQEALTNVAKHAATDTAHVDITYSPNSITIMIINGGCRGTAGPSGRETGHPSRAITGPATGPGRGSGHRPTPFVPATRGTLTTSSPNSGYGLISMRERAQSIGGHLEAGHHPEVGFHVTATLPLHPATPTTPDQGTR